jgi:hypothetical protein
MLNRTRSRAIAGLAACLLTISASSTAVSAYSWQSGSGACWGTYNALAGDVLASEAKFTGGNGTKACFVYARVECKAGNQTRRWFSGSSVYSVNVQALARCGTYGGTSYTAQRTNVGAGYPS